LNAEGELDAAATKATMQYWEACPEVLNDFPIDNNPAIAAQGSFRGYTNRFTMSNVSKKDGDYSDFKKDNTENTQAGDTFSNESADMAAWTDSARAGCITGFAVFGLGILFTVAMIAIDMRKRKQWYEELIADDLQKMRQLGMDNKMAEINKELAARLAGGKDEAGVDDQLVTQALELRAEDFARYM